MTILSCLTLLASTFLATMAAAQTRPADPVRTVPLQAVQVRPPQVLTLRAPGESRGLLSNFTATALTPARQVAVWHPTPDTSRRYLVRTVRVRLGSREPANPVELAQARREFAEGYLTLTLVPATAAGVPADSANLLLAPLRLTPELSAHNQHGWLSFDVAAQQVLLPAKGVFVVAEGHASPGEQWVRHRTLRHPLAGKRPPEDYVYKQGEKPTAVFLYEEVQAVDRTTRLVPSNDYPALLHLHVAAPADCRSWLHGYQPGRPHGWFDLATRNALLRQTNPALKLPDYNYDLKLEVEVQ